MKPRYFKVVVVLVASFIIPASAAAESPFDGTWRVDMSRSKPSDKPVVLSVINNTFDCSSCRPEVRVPADGKEHAVTGQFFDSISVRPVNDSSIEIVARKNGNTAYEQTDTASGDGNTLKISRTDYSPDAKEPSKLELTATRIAQAPAGANHVSGSWRIEKRNASENWLISTYRTQGDQLIYSSPDGEGYTAKLDGKDYPAKGGYVYNAVSLRSLGERTIEESDKLNGKVVSVWKMTVSADGKTMTQIATWPQTGQTITYIADKQ
jgi:hypothetical protein